MSQVTVTVTPFSENFAALECTECKGLGLFAHDKVSDFVYNHLINEHQVNPTTIDIKNPES